MAAARRRNLLSTRRRIDDEGEDEEEVAGLGDDSASDVTVLSDAEDQLDAEGSDLSENEEEDLQHTAVDAAPRKSVAEPIQNSSSDSAKVPGKEAAIGEDVTATSAAFPATADTLAMLNGLQRNEPADDQEAVEFEETIKLPDQVQVQTDVDQLVQGVESASRETLGQRRNREHEEYRLKRDTNPAFVPNRGGFFMHDQRNDAFDPSRPLQLGRGRGRGRDFTPTPRLPFRSGPLSVEASGGRWDHDLHESVVNTTPSTDQIPVARPHGALAAAREQAYNTAQLPLSKSISVGTIMVKCSLPFTERPVKFLKMTVRQHTRLPDLRPPLRRDKPVRLSFPDHGPRYIFPSPERSFIFIPRANRPNQQVAKSRSHGVFGHSQSRRTSAYGGSIYEPSVARSRRSSFAQDNSIYADGTVPFRPVANMAATTGKPVVRLPSNAQSYPVSSFGIGQGLLPAPYDIPEAPEAPQNSSAASVPMDQPRPQKAVSLATIESPYHAQLQAPQQREQQPFHQQVPAQMNDQLTGEGFTSPAAAQFLMPGQSTAANQMPHFPEGAVNAQPFQPLGMAPQHPYANPYAPSQSIYYYPMQAESHLEQYPVEGMTAPYYIQQGPYLYPYVPPPSAPEDGASAATQSGTMAQERNGMVYYYDSSTVATGEDATSNVNYTVPGAGGMLTPGPEGYYYPQGAHGGVY